MNTLRIHVAARYYCEVDNLEQLQEALNFARQQNCPVFILGGCSNIVFKADYPGLIIRIALHRLKVQVDVAQGCRRAGCYGKWLSSIYAMWNPNDDPHWSRNR